MSIELKKSKEPHTWEAFVKTKSERIELKKAKAAYKAAGSPPLKLIAII